MGKREHWTKKLRRELETTKAELREVCLRPESGHSMVIMARERMDDRTRQAWLSGSSTYGATGGYGLIPMIEAATPKEGSYSHLTLEAYKRRQETLA